MTLDLAVISQIRHQNTDNKSKNRQIGLNQNNKLCIKGCNQQSENAALRMKEDICKPYI